MVDGVLAFGVTASSARSVEYRRGCLTTTCDDPSSNGDDDNRW
ncbi:putative proline-rich receptor-like protein kinase PERK13 [Iris pallida]|uniref:Proline-rich receptor-like protein kinase PERK13 n=1 Tax=Iris pallida TaxID=29817 RepID=A0AAX6F5M6_IRIPA|nr:putative proline-rich receptor-like protein kinase PERK13 [Iris pallida]KAJ6830747.1 putative proline-rich receptor-like protein kinase PERK13 [Iris pallida]